MDVYMSTRSLTLIVRGRLILFVRFPSVAVWRHQVCRHLHGLLDRRQEPVPWIRVHCRGGSLYPTRGDRACMALLEASQVG